MTVDERSFRRTLGCFATGVTVVTTLIPNTTVPLGVTVSSFSSLSLSPPLILFSLGKDLSTIDSYCDFGYFAVNVLAETQRDISIRFSSRVDDRWRGIKYKTWESGVPILDECLANLECRLSAVHDGGDHLIFVGEVVRLRHEEGGAPLIYFRGAYMEYGPPPPVAAG